ncbi:MAG TPA: uroporphyrinogen-III C-methyltransferase [Blastocatellia bacterium]|nr:uroporphyrinogen-III C-methyltransferase [Blastocatellia bacterium]
MRLLPASKDRQRRYEERRVGKVYLVGAGPGDPELITIKAARAISLSDVIVYDYLVNPEVLAHARKNAELIYVGKRAGSAYTSQDQINNLLIELGIAGKVVARVKGGDPFIFGRGGEEAEALTEAAVEWEVIPGVSAGNAAAAFAGIPLTHRDHSSSVVFVAGHNGRDKQRPGVDWSAVSRSADTIVIFMCAETIGRIAGELIAAGRPSTTPIAIVRWGSYEHQEVFTGSLEDASRIVGGRHEERQGGEALASGIQSAAITISSPAIAIVGEVVLLREKLQWFKHEVEIRLGGLWGEAPVRSEEVDELLAF